MNKKEMLIECAKEIAEHCAEHSDCNDNCAFYIESGNHVCLLNTAYCPSDWKFDTIEEN